MTQPEIEVLFNKTVQGKDFGKRSGYNRKVVYNYRHRKTNLGTMLEVLFLMGVINAVVLPLSES